MKDIKTFIIGFLTCACMFLIMGHADKTFTEVQTKSESQIGRYQMSAGNNYLWMIEQETGQLYSIRAGDKEQSRSTTDWYPYSKPMKTN